MPGAKKWHHALPALLFFLLFSPGSPGTEGTRAASRGKGRELRALQGERRVLLEILLRAVRDSSSHEAPGISSSSKKRLSTPRHPSSSRHSVISTDSNAKEQFIKHFSEILARDPAVKDKILQFFSGSIALPAECNKLFYRVYHHTRDCSTQSLYQRCARMLARIAASPPCA